MPDDYSANTQTTGTVAVGGSATGTIESAYDQDWFAVELVAGRTYQFDLEGSPTGRGTLPDTYLRAIYNSQGRYQSGTYNDNFDGSRNSRVTFTPEDSGTYYVRVSGDRDEIGSYTLSVRDMTPSGAGNPPPAFDQQSYAFDLAENADGSTTRLSLGSVLATDPDGGSVSYGIAGGNAAGLFEIDTASGELFYVGGGEDYETGSTRFELTVRASDGDETTDTSVTVNVTDVDEPVVVDPPVAQPDQSTPQTVSEPSGEDFSRDPSTSGWIAVGDTATGRIGSNGDRDWFAVELVAGRTYVIDLRGSPTDDGTLSNPFLRGIYDADGDRISGTLNNDAGTGRNSRVTFTAAESGTHYIAAGAHSSRQGTYEVEVTDTSPPETPQEQVQQQPPAFDRQAYLFDLAENTDGSANRVSLGTVSAADPDGGSVSYSIAGGNAAGLFEIDAASGELFYVGGGEDYETGATRFELTVRASDGAQTTDATVTVDVTDVAEAPAFAQAGYAFDLAENADGSTDRISLGTVSATDPDGGSVTYGIEGGNESGRFELDAASGELFYVGGGEDYETGSTRFELTVRASDGEQTTDTAVTVNVTDVDEPVVVEPPVAQEVQSVPQTVSEGTTDLPNDNSTPGRVAVGGSATGTIGAGRDQDRFAVELEAGRTYQFDLEGSPGGGGTLSDTYFRAIYNSEGRYQSGTYNDDFEGSRDSRVTFTPEESGTYYARVSGDRNETGTYTLSVTDVTPPEAGASSIDPVIPEPQEPIVVFVGPDQDAQTSPSQGEQESVSEGATDLPADTTTTGRIAPGGSVTGTIDTIVEVHHQGASETDWFAAELVAGTLYRIDLKGSTTGHGTLRDPYLYGIFDSDGNRIPNTANDDSRAPSRNSRVEFTPEEDGTYFIAAGAYAGHANNTGTYTLTVSTPNDDYSAGMDTEGSVPVGGSAAGEIETTEDQDWFAATLEAGTTYRVVIERNADHENPLHEPNLVGIYDSNGAEIPTTTIRSSSLSIWSTYVEITPETAGTHYIAVDGQLSFGKYTGGYTVSVKAPNDDYSAGTDTEGTVVVGGTATGEIEVIGDEDWFAVDVVAGTHYRVELITQSGYGTVIDPNLAGVYYESGGNLLRVTAEPNRGIGNHAPLMFEATETGTYYIAAADAHSRGVGTYTLAVTEILDDYAADTAATGTVAVGGMVEGDIETPRDEDWFAVELEAGTTYRVDLKRSPTGADTLRDPYLRGIHDADGERFANTSDDNGGWGLNSWVHFTPGTDGTYYVAAADAVVNHVGVYTMSVEEVDGM